MANRNREKTVTVNGKDFVARVSMQQLAEIEDVTGPLLQAALLASNGGLKVSSAIGLLKISVGDKLTEDDIMDDLPGVNAAAAAVMFHILSANIKTAPEKPASGEAQTQAG